MTRVLGDCLLQDLVVRGPLETFVAEVGGIVPLATQPLDDADVQAHVGEEAHDRSLRDADFFLGEPGRVFQRLLDVFPFEVGIALEDLVERGAVRNLRDDDRHGDPHPADAGPAAHDLLIERDSVKHGLIVARLRCGASRATTRPVGGWRDS